MRKIVIVGVLLGVGYFVLGLIAVQLNIVSSQSYENYATIVGGLASLFGLIGLSLPRIKSSDIQDIETKYLVSLGNTAEELQGKMNELSSKEKEILRLATQKKEMEFLVRKASLSLFLQDQIERHEKQIINYIESNKEISELISEVRVLKEKCKVLNEEITTDPNVELLTEVIAMAKKKDSNDDYLQLSFPLRSVFELTNEIAKRILGIRL